MPTQIIENFRQGLDTRRDQWTSSPGSLLTLENAHINPGAEIEKRQKFGISANSFPANTFGLEMTAGGLITFGSVIPALAVPLPAGVSYQQLPTPFGLLTSMTAVVYSCNFQGRTFVIAQFTGLTYYVYYDGTLVGQIRYGIMTTAGLTQAANDLATVVNTLVGWTATANVDANGNTLTGSVIIRTPPGVYFRVVFTKNSVGGGVIGDIPIATDYPGVAGIQAFAKFKITAVGGVGDTYSITAFSDVGGTIPVDLMNGALAVPAGPPTIAQMIVLITNAINNNTPLTGYTALNDTFDTIFVYAPLTLGAVTFNLTVTTTGAATTGATTSVPTFSLTLDGTYTLYTKQGSSQPGYNSITATAKNGTAGYVFNWLECNADGTFPVLAPSTVLVIPNTSSVVHASPNFTGFGDRTGYFRCFCADSSTQATTSAATFVMPAVGATVTVNVSATAWTAVGAYVYVATAGFFMVTALVAATSLTLKNIGCIGNAPVGNTIAISQKVSLAVLSPLVTAEVNITSNL